MEQNSEFLLFLIHVMIDQENNYLKILNLSWNGFGDDGSFAMGEALKVNTTLEELDLTYDNAAQSFSLVIFV